MPLLRNELRLDVKLRNPRVSVFSQALVCEMFTAIRASKVALPN
jgi:hypothetical protein